MVMTGYSYGVSEKADWHLYNVHHDKMSVVFSSLIVVLIMKTLGC